MRSRASVETPGAMASRMRSCISATTRPARRIAASSSAVRTGMVRVRNISGTSRCDALVDHGHQPGRDLLGGPLTVHLDEQRLLLVVLDQRRGLPLVEVE